MVVIHTIYLDIYINASIYMEFSSSWFCGWVIFSNVNFMVLWCKSKFIIFILNPNLKAFILYFKRIITQMFYFYAFVCVYKPVSIYVYAYYIHKTLYFYIQYAFIIQIIKMGEGFCFFS